MKVLGIDTSTLATTISVLDLDELICEYTVNTKKTHSQKLMVMIENMLKVSDININDIDLIAVCEGPGSFTGLRIAMATAKAIAHANNLDIISVDSLEVLARNIEITDKKICCIIDAQKTQVYNGIYKYENDKLIPLKKIDVLDTDELLENLDEEFIIVGEATKKYKEKIHAKNKKIPSRQHNVNRASSLCEIAIEKYKKGEDIKNCYQVNPRYIRKSQAEIDYENRNK